jgi:hypothetical protein
MAFSVSVTFKSYESALKFSPILLWPHLRMTHAKQELGEPPNDKTVPGIAF